MRLLLFELDEPVPGNVLTDMAAEVGDEEASRRYRAIVVTTLRQLRGLDRARIRLRVRPDDGSEAVRFWLLPRLADRWIEERDVFRTQGWEIDFGSDEVEGFDIFAEGDIRCPLMGARWVQAALPGLGSSVGRVTGPVVGGGRYFSAVPAVPNPLLSERTLPPLPLIQFPEDWLVALESPLGPALARAWEEEG